VSQQNTADVLAGRMLQGLHVNEQFQSVDRQEELLLSVCKDGQTSQHPAQLVCNNQ